ncbi:MAG: PcfB family protein [Lachnospiraceae bacterium]|nr:PcfB family protein [Lachnospiraceae bacterium]
MQEEVTQKTMALVFKASRLSADVMQKAMKAYLEERKHKPPPHGKISVKKLIGQGQGAKSIEITDENIKSFSRVAMKYNVDFSVKRDRTTQPPKYLVFFKGKDADVITQAFKEFVKVNERKKQRVSIRAKLRQFQKNIAQDNDRERTREKNKDRGQSL